MHLHLCRALSSDSQTCVGLRVRHCRALQTCEGLILPGHPSVVPSLSHTQLSSAMEEYTLHVIPFVSLELLRGNRIFMSRRRSRHRTHLFWMSSGGPSASCLYHPSCSVPQHAALGGIPGTLLPFALVDGSQWKQIGWRGEGNFIVVDFSASPMLDRKRQLHCFIVVSTNGPLLQLEPQPHLLQPQLQ